MTLDEFMSDGKSWNDVSAGTAPGYENPQIRQTNAFLLGYGENAREPQRAERPLFIEARADYHSLFPRLLDSKGPCRKAKSIPQKESSVHFA
jgi:hypothetical protein